MATERIDNVRTEILRWAFQRAGYSKEMAIEAFPKLQSFSKLRKFYELLAVLKIFRTFAAIINHFTSRKSYEKESILDACRHLHLLRQR